MKRQFEEEELVVENVSPVEVEGGNGYTVVYDDKVPHPPFLKTTRVQQLRKNFQLRDEGPMGDIVIATFPKCGTTWMQQIGSDTTSTHARKCPPLHTHPPLRAVIFSPFTPRSRRPLKSHRPYVIPCLALSSRTSVMSSYFLRMQSPWLERAISLDKAIAFVPACKDSNRAVSWQEVEEFSLFSPSNCTLKCICGFLNNEDPRLECTSTLRRRKVVPPRLEDPRACPPSSLEGGCVSF